MNTLTIPVSVLGVHFVADFLLQTDWMAINKSKQNYALTIHVFVYSLCFLVFGLHFAAITFYLHWITDYVTSRVTSKLWVANQRHWFFVVIGLDQLIHFTTLAITWHFLRG